jgi:hypothetical protein
VHAVLVLYVKTGFMVLAFISFAVMRKYVTGKAKL